MGKNGGGWSERDAGRPSWTEPKTESVRDSNSGCRRTTVFVLLAMLSLPVGLVSGFGLWLFG